MIPNRQALTDKLYETLLIVSFIPSIIKSITYLLVGILYPLLILTLLTSPFLYIYLKRKNYTSKLIKYWSILLIGYGLLRIVLYTLILIKPSGVPSGAFYQFTFWYTFKSVFYILLGICLLSKRKLIVRSIFFKK